MSFFVDLIIALGDDIKNTRVSKHIQSSFTNADRTQHGIPRPRRKQQRCHANRFVVSFCSHKSRRGLHARLNNEQKKKKKKINDVQIQNDDDIRNAQFVLHARTNIRLHKRFTAV